MIPARSRLTPRSHSRCLICALTTPRRQMADGIDSSTVVLVFITQRYMLKASGEGPARENDNCKYEFDYATLKKGVGSMIAVVMEPECRTPSTWRGSVCGKLGAKLYVDASTDSNEATEAAVEHLLKLIRDVGNEGGEGNEDPARAIRPEEAKPRAPNANELQLLELSQRRSFHDDDSTSQLASNRTSDAGSSDLRGSRDGRRRSCSGSLIPFSVCQAGRPRVSSSSDERRSTAPLRERPGENVSGDSPGGSSAMRHSSLSNVLRAVSTSRLCGGPSASVTSNPSVAAGADESPPDEAATPCAPDDALSCAPSASCAAPQSDPHVVFDDSADKPRTNRSAALPKRLPASMHLHPNQSSVGAVGSSTRSTRTAVRTAVQSVQYL